VARCPTSHANPDRRESYEPEHAFADNLSTYIVKLNLGVAVVEA
jgi:hypothetical protein